MNNRYSEDIQYNDFDDVSPSPEYFAKSPTPEIERLREENNKLSHEVTQLSSALRDTIAESRAQNRRIRRMLIAMLQAEEDIHDNLCASDTGECCKAHIELAEEIENTIDTFETLVMRNPKKSFV